MHFFTFEIKFLLWILFSNLFSINLLTFKSIWNMQSALLQYLCENILQIFSVICVWIIFFQIKQNKIYLHQSWNSGFLLFPEEKNTFANNGSKIGVSEWVPKKNLSDVVIRFFFVIYSILWRFIYLSCAYKTIYFVYPVACVTVMSYSIEVTKR